LKSIRHELTVRVLRGVLPLILLGSLVVYVAVRQVIFFEFDTALRQEAQVLQAVTERVGSGVDFDYRPGTNPQAAPDFGQDYGFELTLSDGSLLKRSDGLRDAPLSLPAGALGQTVIRSIRLPNGHSGRGCSLTFEPKVVDPASHLEPVDRPNAPPGPVRLVIAASTKDLERLLAALAVTEALVGVVLVFATVVSLRRSVREGLAPVEILAAEVTAVDPENLTARVNVLGQPGELRPIAARINQLLGRLDDAFAREKRFTANAAHELRTPIAEIRAIAEVAVESPNTEDRNRGLAEIVKVSQEMQEMISNLLAMARARSGTLQVEPRRVDLSSLLLEWCSKRESLGPPSSPPIRRSVQPDVWTDTDPVVLGAVVNNLLDNAASYTPRGGDIELRLQHEADALRITVENSCEPLESEDVRGMFEPFWRKRGTTVDGSHSGLGLALVRSLCEAIRVTVSAELLNPRRLAVSVRIPK
jgi:two-component system sensor histidine kinase QseC